MRYVRRTAGASGLRLGALCACIVLFALPARAERAVSVVLVETEGSRAWAAAERRLLAELRTLDIRLVLLTGRTDADRRLAQHGAVHHAVAAIQALREGDRGIIRFWLAPGERPGGYAHASIDLRGADVLERAVAPVFQQVFGRVSEGQERLALEPSVVASGERSAQEPDAAASGERRAQGPHAAAETALYHPYGVALQTGPWFYARFRDPSVALALRLRGDWLPHLSLQGDVIASRGVDSGKSNAEWLAAARGVLLVRPWPRSRVVAGLGPGLGFAWARDGSRMVSVLGRAEMHAPVRPTWGLVLALTTGLALDALTGDALEGAWEDSAISFDMLVGVEWQLGTP